MRGGGAVCTASAGCGAGLPIRPPPRPGGFVAVREKTKIRHKTAAPYRPIFFGLKSDTPLFSCYFFLFIRIWIWIWFGFLVWIRFLACSLFVPKSSSNMEKIITPVSGGCGPRRGRRTWLETLNHDGALMLVTYLPCLACVGLDRNTGQNGTNLSLLPHALCMCLRSLPVIFRSGRVIYGSVNRRRFCWCCRDRRSCSEIDLKL